MLKPQTTQALLSATSDGLLAGLLMSYLTFIPKPERSAGRMTLLILLVCYAITSVLQSVILMSLSAASMAFFVLLARAGLMAGLVYGAILLTRLLGSVRDDAKTELHQKLEQEFADRRKIEQQLAHLASFAESDPNSIVELDGRNNLRYLNPTAEQVFPDLKSKGKPHPIFEGIDTAISVMRREQRSMRTRVMQVGERIYRQQICLLETGAGARLHMADITGLTKLERIQTDLLRRMPGEMKAPLSRIQQNLQRLLGSARHHLDREQEEELLTALKQLADLGRLSDEVIDNFHIDTGRVEIRRQRADLAALVREIAEFLRSVAQAREVTISVRSEPAVVEMLFDRDKLLGGLTQALQKIIEMAGPGALDVSLSGKPTEAQCVIAAPLAAGGTVADQWESRFAPARAIIEAHGGRWSAQKTSTGVQCALVLPILTTEDLFYERVKAMHESAVGHGSSLLLMRVHFPAWPALHQAMGEEAAQALRAYLQQLVSHTLRSSDDFAMQCRQSLWLALPQAKRLDGQHIAERLQQQLLEHLAQQSVNLTVTMDIRIAAFPEDGRTAESLLLLTGWFADAAMTNAAPAQTGKPASRAA
ncbi:MAG TPA: diguanylate cyclase [Elusimicrobiota bacterium]|nr:diguanylate cyclase [Elusimicrobiota bacterium]